MAARAAADKPACSCTNISIMQLFYELKQRFPAVPDRVVSECIRKNFHDKHMCEVILSRENQTYLLHSYPASLKMCAATSEPSSPLTSSFHGLGFCDKFSTRPEPGGASASTPPSPRLTRPRDDVSWFGDALSMLRVNEARGESRQAVWCRDRFPCVDQLRYLRDAHDEDVLVDDPFLLGHEEGECGVQRDEPGGDTVRDYSRRVGHHHARQGDSDVSVSSSGSSVDTSEHQRRSQRPDPPSALSHNVFGSDEPRSAPVVPCDFNPFSSPLPGDDHSKCEPQQIRFGARSSAVQDPYEDNVELIDDFRLDVNCRLQRSPVGSSSCVDVTSCGEPKRRVRSMVQLRPMPHYSSLCGPSPRSYTSVNLTLRPPSSEPQPPVDIQSAGSSLTYSTSSYDPRQGYQSQLQIRIGPGASGSVTAVRTRAPDPAQQSPLPHCAFSLARSGSLPDVSAALSVISENSEDSVMSLEEAVGGDRLDLHTRELLVRQMERKTRLQVELRKEKEKLRKMQREVQSMKRDLEHRELLKRRSTSQSLPIVTTILQEVQQLRQEIQWLQEECKLMTHEVDDLNADNRVPLGETDEEFYKNIYTGQRGRILPPRMLTGVRPRRRPGGEGSPCWRCTTCTYRNHPLLDKCEQCDMPHIEIGSSPGRMATTAL